ncbi:MAG: hypothetical protein KAT34_19975 [Candidatus Aminicenantes bacterium]|nr:hypothetical protein [Candidatus Aminicenantes bacterium]
MTHIDRFFETLEKEGLYKGRIAVAGKEYSFPAKTESHSNSGKKSYLKLEKLLKYGSIFIILLLTGFVLRNLQVKKPPVIPEETAEDLSRERNLAGIEFYPVNSNEYSFSYMSGKIFLHKIRTTGSDIRLIINDLVDRVNKQAKKTRLEAFILTPRHGTNKHHMKLWQDGFLEKGQVFMLRAGEAVLVKETNSDLISIDKIADWERVCEDKTVFTRIMLKKVED